MDFSVNGVRTQQIVQARTPSDAKRLIQAQYSGARIALWYVTRI